MIGVLPFFTQNSICSFGLKDSVQRPSVGAFSSKISFKKVKRFPYADDLPLTRGGLRPARYTSTRRRPKFAATKGTPPCPGGPRAPHCQSSGGSPSCQMAK